MKIKIAVFAYNEENNIGYLIKKLASQSIFNNSNYEVQCHLLVNGCSDSTAVKAEENIMNLCADIKEKFCLHVLEEGGKSRTWNFFVHDILEEETEYTFFIDADIKLTNDNQLFSMLKLIVTSKSIDVVNSKPIKDISYNRKKLTFIEKLIVASSNKLDNSNAICGQLYLIKASKIRNISMPVGLPVEDGFLCAMIKTNLLTSPDTTSNIINDNTIFHVYESIVTVSELIEHQTRIVIGGAINKVIFDHINEFDNSVKYREIILKNISSTPDWLGLFLDNKLPMLPYGYVPFSFLLKRLTNFSKSQNKSIMSILILSIGVCFDFLVYARASYKMSRGTAAGHW